MNVKSLLSKLACVSFVVVGCLMLHSCGDDGGSSGGGSGGGGGTDNIPAKTPSRSLAFPGADGGARSITGGAGGDVYIVTSLSDDNTIGTLRYGVTKVSGKRTIVFAVGGIIDMKSDMNITAGDVTIAGQTAPGDGICLKNYAVNISANNVIIRYLRFRMGDEKATEADALSSSHHDNDVKSNILIDHCSVSWSTDECASFYGNKNFTLQYCIISESLRISIHDKGKHGYGGIWGGENASFHHNLLAHHDSRNPRFDHDYVSTLKGPIHFVNNVIYNWGGNSAYGGESSNGSPRYINMVNNYYKSGHATGSSRRDQIVNPTTKCDNCTSIATSTGTVTPGKFYITGNYMYGYSSVTSDNWSGVKPDESSKKDLCKATSYAGIAHAFVETAAEAYESVLQYAGASYKRDAVDARIVENTRNGSYSSEGSKGSTGGLIDSQSDVGGWPAYYSGTVATDSDKDGMPDAWEAAQLNANGWSSYGIQKFRPNGYNLSAKYTNLEVYLNELVKTTFPAGAKADATR